MTARIHLLIAAVLLLAGHLAAWRILEAGRENPGLGYDAPAAVVFFVTWGVFMALGYRANRVRIKKSRTRKAPAETQNTA